MMQVSLALLLTSVGMPSICSQANDSLAGLEKTLRFLQSAVQVIAAYSVSAADAAPWLQGRKQFALGLKTLAFTFFFHSILD